MPPLVDGSPASVRAALDSLAAVPDESTSSPAPPSTPASPPVVRVNAELEPSFDTANRFLRARADGPTERVSGPVIYDMFAGNDARKQWPLVYAAQQHGEFQDAHLVGSNTTALRLCWVTVFKGILLDIPWYGQGLPGWHRTEILRVPGGERPPTMGKLLEDGVEYANEWAFIGGTDEWGSPGGHSGHLLYDSPTDKTPENDSLSIQIGPAWSVTPFYFYDGAEEGALEFLQCLFRGGASGSGADSLTARHARRCITTETGFPAVVTLKRALCLSWSTTSFSADWDAGDSNLTNTDAGRRRYAVELKGVQRMIVGSAQEAQQ